MVAHAAKLLVLACSGVSKGQGFLVKGEALAGNNKSVLEQMSPSFCDFLTASCPAETTGSRTDITVR